MTYTITTFLIVCPLLLLGGFIDAIAGGGGLITLPAYMIAGVPVHHAIGTNKLSSVCGTGLTTANFYRRGMINMKLGIPTIIATLVGAGIGSNLSLMVDEKIIQRLMLVILPIVAIVVFNKKLFHDNPEKELEISARSISVACTIAFAIGMYDAFYGPGTGTFLIICFTIFSRMSILQANGQAKVINLTSGVTSLVVFLMNGTVLIPLGIAGGACNMLGNYLGVKLAMKESARIVKPTIFLVLGLLFLKIIGIY